MLNRAPEPSAASSTTSVASAPPRKRTRTRTGCLNCRRKKRKCDEVRPACGTCSRRDEHCEWGLKITFRAENAQGLDGRHPSMRKMARKRPPKEFEILDVTQDVISDYHVPSPVSESEEDNIVGSKARSNGHNVARQSLTSRSPHTGQHHRPDTDTFITNQQQSPTIANSVHQITNGRFSRIDQHHLPDTNSSITSQPRSSTIANAAQQNATGLSSQIGQHHRSDANTFFMNQQRSSIMANAENLNAISRPSYIDQHHHLDNTFITNQQTSTTTNTTQQNPAANGSPASQRQTASAVANLLYLSQSGQPQPQPESQPHPQIDIDPALQQGSMDPISMDMINEYSYMEQMQAFTPEGGSEDGIFLPGSAYHELHSTLRNHLIQETRSNAPTRSTTPRYDADSSLHDTSTIEDEVEEPVLAPDYQTVTTIISSLPLLSEEEECALWKNYFDEIAPWLDKFDRDRHFQQIIPTMTKNHAYLRYSMLALSARQLELKETTLPHDRSLALYQEAIHLLLPDLPSRSTAVIATCVILCVLEMLSCSPKAWQRHLDGCASLMEAVGINGFVGGAEQALFWCFARMDVCGGLISSVKTLIPISHWASKRALEADVELFRSTKDFEQWANYAVYLIAQVLDVLAPLPSETLQAPTRNDPKFRARWLKLWKYICDWHHHRPAPLLPTMTIASSNTSPFPTILFSNPAAISGNQLYHTASILMLQNRPPTVRLAPKPRSILWHARQVCGISISNDHHGAWTNGIQPLWIAGRCMSHPSEHKAILELLERIERESGWGTRWRAEDLKEFWGDLGDW